jgi:hypothetical protein
MLESPYSPVNHRFSEMNAMIQICTFQIAISDICENHLAELESNNGVDGSVDTL